MGHQQQVDAVRKAVHQYLSQGAEFASADCCETILVRDGFYCGRSFSFEGQRAVWLVDELQVKCFDELGNLTACLPVPEREAARQHSAPQQSTAQQSTAQQSTPSEHAA